MKLIRSPTSRHRWEIFNRIAIAFPIVLRVRRSSGSTEGQGRSRGGSYRWPVKGDWNYLPGRCAERRRACFRQPAVQIVMVFPTRTPARTAAAASGSDVVHEHSHSRRHGTLSRPIYTPLHNSCSRMRPGPGRCRPPASHAVIRRRTELDRSGRFPRSPGSQRPVSLRGDHQKRLNQCGKSSLNVLDDFIL